MFEKSKNWQIVPFIWRRTGLASFKWGHYALLSMIFIGLVFVGRAGIVEFNKMNDVKKKINQINDKISKFERSNAEIMKAVENFKNESYLESEARKRLNVQKPGERVIVILPPESQSKKQSDSQNKIEKAWNWFKRELNNIEN